MDIVILLIILHIIIYLIPNEFMFVLYRSGLPLCSTLHISEEELYKEFMKSKPIGFLITIMIEVIIFSLLFLIGGLK